MPAPTKSLNNLLAAGIFLFTNLLSILTIVLPKFDSILWLNNGVIDHISDTTGYSLLGLFVFLLLSLPFAIKIFDKNLLNLAFVASMIACLIAIFGGFYTDIYFLLQIAKYKGDASVFINSLVIYINQNMAYYAILIMLPGVLLGLYYYLFKIEFKKRFNKIKDKLIQVVFVITAFGLPAMLIIPLSVMNISLVKLLGNYYPIPATITLLANLVYAVLTFLMLMVAYKIRKKTKEQLTFLIKLTNFTGGLSGFVLLFEIFSIMAPYFMLKNMGRLAQKNVLYYAGIDFKANIAALGAVLVLTLALLGWRKHIKKMQFDDLFQEDNAGTDHGGAKWASTEDITAYGYFKKLQQIYAGYDENGNKLYFPVKNRTVVAPPGAGKTSTAVIPFLLQYDGPIFAMDLKGELWAVTARYRYEKLKRKQCAIDPFNVIPDNLAVQYKADFSKKPDDLLQKVYINPFLAIPSDPRHRQRVLQSLATSFIVRDSEGGNSEHFYKLCESFVSGSIDYILNVYPPEEHNFKTLLQLTQISSDDFNALLEDMLTYGGESASSAFEIQNAGSDERGGILTTVSGQLKWLLDINMQELLGSNNFSIADFIEGNCDVYLILPAYAVKSHGRIIRMMLSLICETINLNSNNLCGKEYVFLLDELAQLGKSDGIERLIEVYRTYDVVLWSIFQSCSQIETYDKPDLFKDPGQGGALQFFKTKNPATMKWIQEVFGKRTILQKTLSSNKGNQSQKNQVFGGSVSSGEGESIHSGGVDLVQVDEIREMPKDEQWFLIDDRPIKSKKLPYYTDPLFAGKWDINPFERSNYWFVAEIKKRFGNKEEVAVDNEPVIEVDKTPRKQTATIPTPKEPEPIEEVVPVVATIIASATESESPAVVVDIAEDDIIEDAPDFNFISEPDICIEEE